MESEQQKVLAAELLEKSENELYLLLVPLNEVEARLYSPTAMIARGKEIFAKHWAVAHQVVCERHPDKYSHISDPTQLTLALADDLAQSPQLAGVSALVVAALVIRRGLDNLCP